MSERFITQKSDFDLKYEFRVADTYRVEKTKEDYWNNEEECFDYGLYLEYLYDNNAFLTEDEANKIFNNLHEENEELIDIKNTYKQDWKDACYYNDELKEENKRLKEELDGFEKENEELKKQINDITMGYTKNFEDFNKDKLYVKDNNTEIILKKGKIHIKICIPQTKSTYDFVYWITGREILF